MLLKGYKIHTNNTFQYDLSGWVLQQWLFIKLIASKVVAKFVHKT